MSRDPVEGRCRVVVERMRPEVDGGRFPIKRSAGEDVAVTVDMFADGHDLIAGVLKYRKAPPATAAADAAWTEVPLVALGNDRWGASFPVSELGDYEYTAEAWIDRFGTWLKGLVAKAEAGQDVSSELLEGSVLVRDAGHTDIADLLASNRPQAERVASARDPQLLALMQSRPDRRWSTPYERSLRVAVDPVRARYGAWYEMFPRSCTPDPGRSGTLREAEARLGRVNPDTQFLRVTRGRRPIGICRH